MTKIAILDNPNDNNNSGSSDEEGANNLPQEVDYVYKLLERLDTTDKEELAKTEKEIDQYLMSKQRLEDEEALKKQLEMEPESSRTSKKSTRNMSRTVIKTKKSELEKRRRLRWVYTN